MNWKKIFTIAALTGFSASVATGQGTATTILEGSYISNVFGQSNFIKNPNAKLNTKDVTTVTATVTRSTTTPLVATSEFTVAIGTANGTATWATRAFDAGMKGQNCEARFTYRGFAATSKVHIKQGANTVASLNLTPATDPRIASINFPCGDLSTATTFVVTDTAILAGTNEIGGIYTGLATNMANVAQAEMYGGIEYSGGSQNTWGITQTAYTSDFAASGSNGTAFGKCSAPATAVPQLVCNNMPSGEYQVVWPIFLEGTFSNNLSTCRVIESSTGAVAQEISTGSFNTGTADYTGRTVVITGNVSFSSAGSRTFKLQCKSTAGAINALRFATQGNTKTVIYRFPTSSELVVTPERQNTFGGVKYVNSNQSIRNTSAPSSTYFEFNNATWNQPTLLIGKAAVTTTGSGNDLGFSMPNLPVGQYKVSIRGLVNASTENATTLGQVSMCSFKIRETTIGTDVALQVHRDTVSSTTPTSSRDYEMSFFGVLNNTSVGTRNFRLEAAKVTDNTTGSVGTCQAYSASASERTEIVFLLEPLDQPSNSALYVQGPVLAAATGATIPAGYVGQTQTALSSSTTANIDTVTNLAGTDVTLQPGTYMLFGTIGGAGGVCSNSTSTLVYGRIRDGSNNLISESVISYSGSSALRNPVTGTLVAVVNVTVATVYRLTVYWGNDGGTCSIPSAAVFYASQSRLNAIRLN